MSFAQPHLLLLAVLAPAFIAGAVWRFAVRRRRAARALADDALVERLGGAELLRFPTLRLLLVGGAAAAIGIAAAGPRWGVREVEGTATSRSIVLALDVSKSMLAQDVEPNRLEQERLFVRRLLRELAGDRIGMVVFAGRAYTLSPLTVDHSALHLYLDALDPEIVSQGGSSLGSALSQALALVRGAEETSGDRAILLVSDGETLDDVDAPLDLAQQAARENVRVFTVGIGTPGGANVPEIDPRSGAVNGYKYDDSGELVVSRLDAALLNELAEQTGGRYFAVGDGDVTDRVIAALGGLQGGEQLTPGRKLEAHDRFVVFVALALVLLALDQVVRRFGRMAGAVAGRRVSPAARIATLALLVFAVTGAGVGDKERGNRLYRAGKYAEAVEAYMSALHAGDDGPDLRYNLGTALLQLGRHAEAEQHFRAALDGVDPELRQRTYYNLGNRFLDEARESDDPAQQGALLRGAVQAYQHALRLRPEDTDAKWNLEMALREQQDQPQSAQSEEQESGEGESEQQQEQPQGGGAQGAEESQQEAPQPEPPESDRPEMSREQADRILSAIEQDERDLTRRQLRKGQRRTPVRKDW